MNLITVASVTIDRAEGLSDECGPRTFTSTANAEAYLRIAAETAPNTGGYDKCDLLITFSDGETYSGRIDLQRQHTAGYSIADHVESYVGLLAGTRRPAWMTDHQWAEACARYAAHRAEALAWLLKYLPVLRAVTRTPLTEVRAIFPMRQAYA